LLIKAEGIARVTKECANGKRFAGGRKEVAKREL
jgi:hypothetical protein